MSDEARKRSRAWVGWAAVLAVVLYPLATGPVDCLYGRCGNYPTFQASVRAIYRPLSFLCQRSTKTNAMLGWYLGLWHRVID